MDKHRHTHAPPIIGALRRDHGGHLKNRSDLASLYLEVVLNGLHDSDNHLATDPNLEPTGTYSVCHAPFPDNLPESECDTWVPHADNYTWHENVQIHVRFSRSNPAFLTDTHTHARIALTRVCILAGASQAAK